MLQISRPELVEQFLTLADNDGSGLRLQSTLDHPLFTAARTRIRNYQQEFILLTTASFHMFPRELISLIVRYSIHFFV